MPTVDYRIRLSRLQAAVTRAERDLAEYFYSVFKPGDRVSWLSSRGNRLRGSVRLVSRYGPRMQVRNENSGKDSWISLSSKPELLS